MATNARSRTPAPVRRRPAKKTTLKDLLSNPLFAVGLVIASVLIFVLLRNLMTAESNYFCEGVVVNNVDMSRYTKQEGEKLIEDWASDVLSTEYTLSYEQHKWTFRPIDVGASINTREVLDKAWNLGHVGSAKDRGDIMLSLKYSPQYLSTELHYDEALLTQFVTGIADALYIAAVDADVLVGATRPEILSDSVEGRALDTQALLATLIGRMNNGGDTAIALPVYTVEPSVSSTAAEDGLQKIVEYSTSTTDSSSVRLGNVRTALNNFMGFVVKPGETVSFNEVVGHRTVLRGYVEAPVYYGTAVTRGIGGGVCQASSTLYGAILLAGMDIVQRHSHSMVVGYCEPSMDAAVSDDASQDMVFVNNTNHTIYIYTNVNSVNATVYVYGMRPEYRIELVPTVTQNNKRTTTAITKIEDSSGKYAWYTDELVFYRAGKLGRDSQLERVYFDWNTGEEVKRELISSDAYDSERDVYYVGTHKR